MELINIMLATSWFLSLALTPKEIITKKLPFYFFPVWTDGRSPSHGISPSLPQSLSPNVR